MNIFESRLFYFASLIRRGVSFICIFLEIQISYSKNKLEHDFVHMLISYCISALIKIFWKKCLVKNTSEYL